MSAIEEDEGVDILVDPGCFELEVGAEVHDVCLVEPIETGTKLACWRADGPDGQPATVHAMLPGASEREQRRYFEAAVRMSVLYREDPIEGLVPVVDVVPEADLYFTDLQATGTMEGLPALGWELDRKLGFITQICETLSAMHQRRLFHGCLRPGNVLLDESLKPVISDAGVLDIEDSFPGTDTQHEYSPYACREVRQGQPADARSDLFSVGRMLHFLLWGEHPDEPDESLPKLDQLKEAPPGLVRIIRRCTVSDAAKRYASIAELLEELSRHGRADEVGLKHPDGLEGRRSKRAAPGATKEPAGRAPAKKPQPKRAKAPQPPRKRAAPAPAQELEPRSARELVAGAAGLVLVGAALAAAYFSAGVSTAVTAMFVLGAAGATLLLPAVGGRTSVRLLVAAVVVAAALAFNPLTKIAWYGLRAKLSSGSPEERGKRLLAMSTQGVTDFSRLDLAGIDLSAQVFGDIDLSSSDLTGASFENAEIVDVFFDDADLSEANFSGANVEEIDFSLAIGWEDATCDVATRLPRDWRCTDGRPEATDDSGAEPDTD